MEYKQNLHTHSAFCDGKDTPEEMILTAMEKGFSSIGFSGHAHVPGSPFSMSLENTEAYIKEIRVLQAKYAGQMDIFCGLEFDTQSPTALDGYDYILGTVHYVETPEGAIPFDRSQDVVADIINTHFGGDGMAYAKQYYRQLAELPSFGKFDILGHFDIIAKHSENAEFFHMQSKEYRSWAVEAAEALAEKIPLFAVAVARNETMGSFNALVVSSMMGCTISYTIPYAMSVVKPELHKHVLFGFLCGIVTIPLGCFVAGLICRLPIGLLLMNLLPLVIFSAVISAGLLLCPALCVKIFGVVGTIIKIIITIGLSLGILKFVTGLEPIKGLATLEEGAAICLNATVVLCGMFPFMFVFSKLFSRPLKALGGRLSVSETSATGFLSNIITNTTLFEMVNRMDTKGIVLNSAFAVSAAFTFGGHLAFTIAFDKRYLMPVIVGKLVAGFAALILSIFIYRRTYKESRELS